MNEPKINLRQVSTRVEVEDYAKIGQLIADPANGDRDVASYVRKIIPMFARSYMMTLQV